MTGQSRVEQGSIGKDRAGQGRAGNVMGLLIIETCSSIAYRDFSTTLLFQFCIFSWSGSVHIHLGSIASKFENATFQNGTQSRCENTYAVSRVETTRTMVSLPHKMSIINWVVYGRAQVQWHPNPGLKKWCNASV